MTAAPAQSIGHEEIHELTAKLTAEFELNEVEDIPELTVEVEDILELTAEVEDILELTAEVEDILELTVELERQPALRPSKGVEATTNQTQPAREPTREEIIDAMRKFISHE